MTHQLAGKGRPARRKIPMQLHPDNAACVPVMCRLGGSGIGIDWTGAQRLSFDNLNIF